MARETKRKSVAPKASRKLNLAQALPWFFVIFGLISMAASIMLSIEVFDRLKNPSYIPVCNLNPVLSCTSVADSNQSHLFGFPNYFIGIAGYAAVVAIGTAILAGGKFKKWFWQLVEAGLLFSVLFITWLQFETLYRIGALCIFCMIVWICTIPLFWYSTLYNLRAGNLRTPRRLQSTVNFAQRHHLDILVIWFLIILILILKRFWYYWSTLV